MGAIGKERVVSVVLAVLALLITEGQAATRVHYIAAVEVEWDYAPLKADVFNGEPFNPTRHPWVANGEDLIGSTYVKAVRSACSLLVAFGGWRQTGGRKRIADGATAVPRIHR